MTQAKHTPGPWVAEVYEHGEFEIEAHGQGSSGGLLVICSRNRHQGRPYEFEANARLIAAAPTMLEALQDCREALRRTGHDGELAVVDAAIAKATGA